jgi:nitrogen fixation NifU-like protein
MYNDTVMDHFQNPRNTGEIPDADGVGKVGSAECGDIMIMYIKVKDNKLVDVKYKTFGCAAAIATGSIASEMLIGRTLEDAENLTSEEIAEALFGLPEKKMHCSLLAPDAVKAAIADYRSRVGA